MHAARESPTLDGRASARELLLAPALCIVAAACGLLFAQSTAPSPFDASRVIPFLNQTLNWYRQMTVDQQIANDPSEVALVTDNRQLADQIVRLSFDFARAEADALADSHVLSPGSGAAQAQNGGAPEQQAIVKAEERIDQEIKGGESELNSLKQKLAAATGRQRELLQSQIAQSQGEIDLDKARKDAIHNMAQFVDGTGAGSEAGGLRAQIDAMAAIGAVIPQRVRPAQIRRTPKTRPIRMLKPPPASPRGIWDLGEQLFAISRKLRTIDTALTQIQALAKTSSDLRAPFTNRLRTLSREADDLAGQPPAKDPSAVAQQREQVASLTTEFKQLAAVALPLSKQGILLGLYQKSLENWHTEVRGDLRGQLERLLVRLVILGVFIGVVLVFAELGKRAIYRYVHEPHRRYQFLLLRKILVAFAIVVMVGFAFASRLESAVTFAGLLTAGLAVALQSVLVSVVGYFFLIGKYGIRVGDRVQISGVTGEVVDIGLVRMQVMELGGSGVDTPTGRVVAFSNAIVFQPTAGLFKQIPGTNFVWHELSLTLAADSDFHVVRERLLKGVDAALVDFHDEMQRQNRAMERNLIAAPVDGLRPKVHLRLTASGLEALVRFPVDFQHAGEIDERVMSELLKALEEEPKLRLAGSSAQISVRTNPPQAGAAAAG